MQMEAGRGRARCKDFARRGRTPGVEDQVAALDARLAFGVPEDRAESGVDPHEVAEELLEMGGRHAGAGGRAPGTGGPRIQNLERRRVGRERLRILEAVDEIPLERHLPDLGADVEVPNPAVDRSLPPPRNQERKEPEDGSCGDDEEK